jgi:solute carrier family 35, member F1/2
MNPTSKDTMVVAATGSDALPSSASGSGDDVSPIHGSPQVLEPGSTDQRNAFDTVTRPRRTKRERFGYLMTRDFWLVLLLGQILALCLTGTNTLTTLLVIEGTSIPAFQTFFNYLLLNLIYTSWTTYKYGFKGWAKLLWKDGWKCTFLLVPRKFAVFIPFISAILLTRLRRHPFLLRRRRKLLHRPRLPLHHHPLRATD